MRDAPILVVDDEPDMRRLIRGCLEDDGFPVIEAADRASAEARLRAGPVALVLLDLESRRGERPRPRAATSCDRSACRSSW
jgi:CheY-like chemotaxis protein